VGGEALSGIVVTQLDGILLRVLDLIQSSPVSKDFPSDVSAQIILNQQPAQTAGLAAYPG